MWVVVSACKVGGRLIEPGDSLPDLTPEQVDKLQRAKCIRWDGPAAKQEPAPQPTLQFEPKPKPQRRRRRKDG